MVDKYQREMQDLQASLYEDSQMRTKLQMELDAKDSEVEQLHQKLTVQNADTASVSSGADFDNDDGFLGKYCLY